MVLVHECVNHNDSEYVNQRDDKYVNHHDSVGD